MHPAFSVIFFTTSSGAGYGLLGVVGICALFNVIPDQANLFAGAAIFALVLITLGLLSSTFHLGHPERAWRALSQWQTSWLSREGVLALLSYVPALAFIGLNLSGQTNRELLAIAGALSALCALATVLTTAMIYASLRSIPAWHNRWVPLNYVLLATMSGLLLIEVLLVFIEQRITGASILTFCVVVVAMAAKLAYWGSIDNSRDPTTTQTALGLDKGAEARLYQSPHSHANYLQQEMGFVIARKHATKLRRLVLLSAFVIPIAVLAVIHAQQSFLLSASLGVVMLVSAAIGILIERWLFFAEAKHSSMLYYGQSRPLEGTE